MSLDLARLEKEVKRRRAFAIISHPDAGKTTLTEKLLLYGGAIHLAGAVKAKKNQKHTTSDWMEIEKQRGISISTTVLQFEFEGTQINLLDTPGHKDFSEDTYRTLMAVDAAVMLIDAGKGVEPQTRKLFEVCRMRGIPIFTFMNKLDRPSRDPLDLMDELEKVLGIRSCPITWPIGSGDRFKGVLDRRTNEVLVFETEGEANVKGKLTARKTQGVDDPWFQEFMQGDDMGDVFDQFKAELELLSTAGDDYDHDRILRGELTPVFFGSAMNNFGVEAFLQKFVAMSPEPQPRISIHSSGESIVEPTHPKFSSFIFKIQANMDPQHRDRVAFMRIVSGKFERNMLVKHPRLGKEIKLSMPLNFFGQERVVVEEGFPGDIVGLVDTSNALRVGDTLTTDSKVEFPELPSFSPEHFAGVVILDPMKRKQLKKGLEQLSQEGVVQVYQQVGFGEKDPILAAVGALQFEVLAHRLKAEYGVDTRIEKLGFVQARWLIGEGIDPSFFEREDSRFVLDRDQNPVVIFKSDWALRWSEDHFKTVQFLKTAPLKKVVKK